MGNVATGEGVVDTIRDARSRFLRPELLQSTEAMIPGRVETMVAPVSYENHELLAAKGEIYWRRPFKLYSETKDLKFLDEAKVLEDFDLCSPKGPGVDDLHEINDLDFQALQAGRFSGFALWPRVVVDEQRVVDIQNAPSHWSYVVALMSPKRIPFTQPTEFSLQSQVDLKKVPYSYTLQGLMRQKKGNVLGFVYSISDCRVGHGVTCRPYCCHHRPQRSSKNLIYKPYIP